MSQIPSLEEYEQHRLEDLIEHEIIEMTQDKYLDSIVEIASFVCDTPYSTVSIVNGDTLYFKAVKGLNVSSKRKKFGFSTEAINHPSPIFIINNADQDERFKDNALVVEPPHIKFYAGARLVSQHGYALGTVTVMDSVNRTLSDQQKDQLIALAQVTMDYLETKLKLRSILDEKEELNQYRKVTKATLLDKIKEL